MRLSTEKEKKNYLIKKIFEKWLEEELKIPNKIVFKDDEYTQTVRKVQIRIILDRLQELKEGKK